MSLKMQNAYKLVPCVQPSVTRFFPLCPPGPADIPFSATIWRMTPGRSARSTSAVSSRNCPAPPQCSGAL